MRRNLKYAVGRGIHNRISGSHMLIAQLLDDLCAAGCPVSQGFPADGRFKLRHQLFGKAVWKRGKRPIQHQARHFPVPAGGVLAVKLFRGLPVAAQGLVHPAGQAAALYVGKAQFAKVCQFHAGLFHHMSQRMAALVAKARGVRQSADAHAVHHNTNTLFRFHVLSFQKIHPYTALVISGVRIHSTNTPIKTAKSAALCAKINIRTFCQSPI